MNLTVEKCAIHLCGSDNIDEVNHQMLEDITEKYPYFAVGHMLLAKKFQSENSSQLLPQVQKTALYFNNPSWLHYQLLNKDPFIPVAPYEPITINAGVAAATTASVNGDDEGENDKVILTDGDDNVSDEELLDQQSKKAESETVADTAETTGNVLGDINNDRSNEQFLNELLPEETGEAQPDIKKDDLIIDQQVEEVPITTEFSSEEIEHSDKLAHDTLGMDKLEHIDDQFKIPVEQDLPGENPITTEFSKEELESSDDLARKTLAGNQLNEVDKDKLVNKEPAMDDTPISDEYSLEEIQASGKLAHDTLKENGDQDEMDDNNIVENKLQEQPALIPGELPHVSPEAFSSEQMLKNIKSILDTPLPSSGKGQPLIPIDPYHTIDYFASQGIKLVLDNNPNDKLGRQLKSFTQWLKHMKKLGPEDSLKDIKETEAESKISNIADSSNTQREVVTEAMADVLIKQGKTEKAIQVYNKLSFLYPDKSTYFANQIKNLKGI